MRIVHLSQNLTNTVERLEFLLHTLGLHLNVKKHEIWWPNRASPDPFPAEVDRIDNAGVKLLGAPIGNKAFITLNGVCKV